MTSTYFEEKTLKFSNIVRSFFVEFLNISVCKVSGFSVLCWQRILACSPSWIRVPIFTFLYFCCYGSKCVGETADVFTGSFPRQWCAWGVCAGGGKFSMHQLCCQFRCWKFPWWQCVGLRLKLSGSVGQDLGCLSSCWYSPLSDALYSSTLMTGSLTVHVHTLFITEV